MYKQRVLLVHNYYQYPGGEDAVFASEQSLLMNHGHAVFEYTDSNKRIGTLGYINSAVKTIWSRPSYNAIKRILKHVKPDIAHFHNTFMLVSPSAYYACAEMGVPVIQTLHNYRLLCPNAFLFRDNMVCEDCIPFPIPLPGIYHRCYRNSLMQSSIVAAMLSYHRLVRTWQEQINCYIVLTEFARQKFAQGGLPQDKIVVKPNFVSSPPNFPRTGPDYVLFVGRLSVEKGVNTLFSAWKHLSGIPLKMVGDGPLAGKVKTFADNHASVDYLGQVERETVYQLMANARFLVFPSVWYEGFPMSIVEAFSLGVPVVASALGSMREIVHDGKLGILFNPGNAADLAAKVEWLWSHPEESQKMGWLAHLEYEQKYTPERNYQLLMDIYQKAMSV